MDVDTKIGVVKRFAQEIISEDELRHLFETKRHPVAYDGFEPSGQIHIAQGVMRAITVNKMLKIGVKFNMLSADWHGWANNKYGGDLEKIQKVGEYLVEVWKACGMDVDKVTFLKSSDVMSSDTYWKTVMQIARTNSVKRILRCAQIMGRSEGESLQASQIFYPCMQCADIFEIGCDITQLGMDQRKVNVLAREIGEQIGFWKPVVVSHHMLAGLQQQETNATGADRAIALKMSKSKPNTAIFMTDTEADIHKKIKKAYCPEKQVHDNPILDYCKSIIFESFPSLKIERPEKFGGDLEIPSYDELVKIYEKGDLHPADLKVGVASSVNDLIDPVRKHFEKNKKAKELLKFVTAQKVTR